MAYGTMSIGNAGFTKKFISTLFLLMHPVGIPYASENPTSPAELYGGTWERIEGKFIMGASDTYPAGSTGGSATHTQTAEEVGRHYHEQIFWVNGEIGTYASGFNYDQFTTYMYSDKPATTNGGKTALNERDHGEVSPMDILNPYYSMYIWRRVA